jgi:hypothetical protein
MKNYLVFDCINTDKLVFKAGQTIRAGESFRLFTTEDNGIEDKIIDESEEQILNWLMSSSGGSLLLDKLELPRNSQQAFSIRKPIVENPRHSDIDLILCDPELPQFSVGIQCKRVKIEALNERQDEVNKLPDIKKAVIQANKQREIFGFHRNYLMIISQIFGRNFKHENAIFRKARPETRHQIYEFPQRESLHEDVGIIFVEIGQPTGKSFRTQVNICLRIDKGAARLDQPPNLTNRIKELFQITD